MKTLMLLRHARAEQRHPNGDKARPLDASGRNAAIELGEAMRERFGDPVVDRALVSSACRTKDTFTLLDLDVRPEYSDALYNCTEEALRQRICKIDDGIDRLLVVGHAPSIPSLAAALVEPLDPARAEELGSNYPPATLTVLTCDVERWQDFGEGQPVHLLPFTR